MTDLERAKFQLATMRLELENERALVEYYRREVNRLDVEMRERESELTVARERIKLLEMAA